MIIRRYPIPSLDPSQLNEAIPESIREDYAEAKRCSYAEAYKGAVVMFRRTVEAVACDKLGDRAKDNKGRTQKLHRLIDRLHEAGFITKDMQESAHEIRYFGNYGAHIQDDGLDLVSSEEVEDVREVTWQLLYTIYVAPNATQRLREKRDEGPSVS